MRRLLPKSLFGQLLLGIALVQSVALAAFILYVVASQRHLVEERLSQRMNQELDLIAATCSQELEIGDRTVLQHVLEMSRIAPSIVAARITDLQGTTLAVTHTGLDHGLDRYERALLSRAHTRQVFKIANGQIEAVTPLEQNGKTVALLWLEPNHAPSLNVVNTVVRIALSYGILALLVNTLPIFLIVRNVTRPLRRLSSATQRVGSGTDMSAEFPLPVTHTNEVGELTVCFNSMAQELQQQKRGVLETVALLDSMLDNAPVGMAFFDRSLRYVRVNDFWAGTHHLPRERHVGRKGTELYAWSIAEQKEAFLSRVFETGEAIRNVEFTGELTHVPGVQRNWLMHFYPVRIQEEEVRWAGVIVFDITERLQTEAALRRTEKLAAAGRLAASIAHEINNPLEAVTNLLYLLQTHEPMDPDAAELINTAQSELARVAEITQQTLQFHRQSSSAAPANMAEILNSLITLHKGRLAAASVNVVRRFRGGPVVFGFGGELRQLFANLISKAIDAMPRGGRLCLTARCGKGRALDGSECVGVRVCVMDTGTGIQPETLQRIFDPFFTTKPETGTGLGLWVSQEILTKHSGTMRVRSRQGERSCTTFMVFIPDERQPLRAVAA